MDAAISNRVLCAKRSISVSLSIEDIDSGWNNVLPELLELFVINQGMFICNPDPDVDGHLTEDLNLKESCKSCRNN